MTISHTASLGGGVIGASWTALFLASGHSVSVYDPSDKAEQNVRDYIEKAWPTLEELGLIKNGNPDAVTFHTSAAEAVAKANFVQESIPERLALKHALYADIETVLKPKTVVASSASGLTLSQLQQGWQNPSQLVLGHPFNPPHLIPLVEIMGNENTNADALKTAEQFYQAIGKVTIHVNKEVPGHVANRLQAAVWREAIHLVKEGVASVEDIDKAMWAGPGLRWAAMGPTLLFHLGAGDGGLAEFCERYTDNFNRWWDDLGTLHLDQALADKLVLGVDAEAKGSPPAELAKTRDAMITAMQKATRHLRTS